MSSLTCKDFLSELNDYLDEGSEEELRQEIEAHLAACPNCWVICDTTKKTVQIYKGAELYPLPDDVHARLRSALQKRLSRGWP